ncbi:hypothetical protein GD1_87 [Paraglaciecola Antarctic GD virus 1]|nr:hypothetical protein GD1_87 [Paraglaciecola Antarctic GD virus 1]
MSALLKQARFEAAKKYKKVYGEIYLNMHESDAAMGWITIDKLCQLGAPNKFIRKLLDDVENLDDAKIIVRKSDQMKTNWYIENKYVLNSFERWIAGDLL